MTTYKPKALVNGYKLGAEFGGKWYVAIPKHLLLRGAVTVQFEEKKKVVVSTTPFVTSRDFNDKFRPGKTYTLQYYLWQ